jgi:hypothetical protein
MPKSKMMRSRYKSLLKRTFHFVVLFNLVFPVGMIGESVAWGDGLPTCQPLVDDCANAVTNAQNTCPQTSTSSGGCPGAKDLASGASSCNQIYQDAKGKCTYNAYQCSKQCTTGKAEIKACLQKINSSLSTIGLNFAVNEQAIAGANNAISATCQTPGAAPASTTQPAGTTTPTAAAGPAGGTPTASAGPSGGAPSGGSTPGGGAAGGSSNPMSALSSLAPLAMVAAALLNKPATPMQNCSDGTQVPQGTACAASVAANGYSSPDGVVNSSDVVDCTKALAYRYTECNTTIAAACIANVVTMMSSTSCEDFGARYCNTGAYVVPQVYSPYPYPLYVGEVIGTQVVTVPSASHPTDVLGEGIGTTYCLRTMQINFCASSSNATCPSCLQLTSLKSPACISNASACNATNATTGTAAQQAACPSDPLFSVPSTSTAVATTTTGATIIGTSTTTGTGTIVDSTGAVPILPASVKGSSSSSSTGSAGFINATGLKSNTARAASVSREIASQYSPSVFSSASQPLADRCNSGRFVHCF